MTTTELTDTQRAAAFGTDPVWAPFRELHARIADKPCACTDDEACKEHDLLDDLEQALSRRESREGGFYLVVECGHCDEDIHDGPNLTTLRHEGLPVVPFDMASQSTFYCDRCRAVNYTGDFDLETEGGEDQDDDEDEAGEEPTDV